MQTSTVDNFALVIPRLPKRTTVCAGATSLTFNGVTMPAMAWAARRGLKWQTVKMRRLRGDSWQQALEPELRKTNYMERWIVARGVRKQRGTHEND